MADKGRNSDAKAEVDAAKPTLKKPTCFVIMPIADHPDYPPGHFSEVYSYFIKPAIIDAGFEPQRADDSSSAHLIHADIISRIYRADLCICDLSSRNPNVMFELGFRQAFDKPVVLVKDDATAKIFDVDPFRTLFYDRTLRPQTLEKNKASLAKSIRETQSQHGSEGEFTSLIRFLKLEAAVLTKSDVSAEDARLEIMLQKIDGLARSVEQQALRDRARSSFKDLQRQVYATELRKRRLTPQEELMEVSAAAGFISSAREGYKTFRLGNFTISKLDGDDFSVAEEGQSLTRVISKKEVLELVLNSASELESRAFVEWIGL